MTFYQTVDPQVPKTLSERVMDYVVSTWAMTKGIDQEKVGGKWGDQRIITVALCTLFTVDCTAIRI